MGLLQACGPYTSECDAQILIRGVLYISYTQYISSPKKKKKHKYKPLANSLHAKMAKSNKSMISGR